MKVRKLLLLLCATFVSVSLTAQNVSVSGLVVDSDNLPLPGASVIVKGDTKKGTSTDLDGHFSISVPSGTTLVFSFIGYDDFEYNVNGPASNLQIRFKEGVNALDELIVVGYGVQKKSVMTSSVSRVNGDALDEGHPTNLQNALKGKVSGVSIISESGQPGSGSKIRIRGISTINNSNPL